MWNVLLSWYADEKGIGNWELAISRYASRAHEVTIAAHEISPWMRKSLSPK